jgi:CO/xanthine dehydrogenase FAD-binding subunit
MPDYCIPETLAEALNLLTLHKGQARIIAGGTDLIIDLRKGKKQAQVLVDITRIPELTQIRIDDEFVEIGAAVSFASLKNHEFIKRRVPLLSEAASSVGALGLQTTATWIGNLVQAMPAADGVVTALALEAQVRVVENGKSGWVNVTELFAGPGKSKIDSTTQIITHLRFQIPGPGSGTAWERIGRRSALTLPILNCAVKVELVDKLIRKAVIALGPVAATPFRALQAESFLTGKLPGDEILCEAGNIAQGETNPRGNPLRASREYRLQIIPVVIRRALGQAVKRAQESIIE